MENPQLEIIPNSQQAINIIGGFKGNKPYAVNLHVEADKHGGVALILSIQSFYNIYVQDGTSRVKTIAIPDLAEPDYGFGSIIDHLFRLLKSKANLSINAPHELQHEKDISQLVEWTMKNSGVREHEVLKHFSRLGFI
jgi:hypothetical protein